MYLVLWKLGKFCQICVLYCQFWTVIVFDGGVIQISYLILTLETTKNLVELREKYVQLESLTRPVEDPGFPVGGAWTSWGGRGLPRRLCFENFVCRNKRIWTLRGACAGHAPSRSANEDWHALVSMTRAEFPDCTCRPYPIMQHSRMPGWSLPLADWLATQ